MAWIKSNESKGIFFSLLIHSALLGSVLINKTEPIKVDDKETKVSLNLRSCAVEKKLDKPRAKEIKKVKDVTKPKPKEPPKKKHIEKPKPKEPLKKKHIQKPEPQEIKKPEPKVKQIEKEPMPIKEKPIEEEQNTQEPMKPVQTKHTQTISSQQAKFVKTNFTIIRDMVLSNVEYPSIARRMKWMGVVEMKLVVSSAGKLISYSVHKSSGRKHLDKAALEAVEAINSKTLPKPKHTTTIILPINFQLE